MTSEATQPDAVEVASDQSLAMLRERLDEHEKQIERLWQGIHSLSQMLEDRQAH